MEQTEQLEQVVAASPTGSGVRTLADGGGLKALVRTFDWATTSLGPRESWPQSLKTAVDILLQSPVPMVLLWGPDGVMVYNDAYSVFAGGRHPRLLGSKVLEGWPEVADFNANVMAVGLAGGTLAYRDQHLVLHRHGVPEDVWMNLDYSPVLDEGGAPAGVLAIVVETTARVIGERRLRTLREVGARTAAAGSVDAVCRAAVEAMAENLADLPAAVLYVLCDDHAAGIAASYGPPPRDDAIRVDLRADDARAASLARVRATRRADEIAGDALLAISSPRAAGPEERMLVLPVTSGEAVAGFLAVSLNEHLAAQDDYRDFLQLVTAQVSRAVATAKALEDERRRAEALAELDRAKTEFFSNVSHEFRTPLTLMLAPAEDALADPDTRSADRERLTVIHRNALRLLKLVNTLLDFSRIEAGRVQASYEPTDLAAYTAELASSFRSAIEQAGLRLVVDAPPAAQTARVAYVDRDLWEKVVLNLLSNAFKHTFEGEIAVRVHVGHDSATLEVRDTGVGIPPEQLPHIFERFHRVPNAKSRTHEGTGIGLALVQELVKLHGGEIAAESVVGAGTTFTVSIPLGTAHLPSDRAGGSRAQAVGSRRAVYVEEALRWMSDGAAGPSEHHPGHDAAAAAARGLLAPGARVLVADDNADMRAYVTQLLGRHWTVESVGDGVTALAAARERAPDLVLSDVMMPGLDGFALLRELRADSRTREVPVILLSARAGEDARIEGLTAGADDYLVKPFTARELVARVGTMLHLARLRREAEAARRESEDRFRALVTASSDVVYRMSADWREMHELQGRDFIADHDGPSRSWLAQYVHPADRALVIAAIEHAVGTKSVFELEHRVLRVDGTTGWTFSRAIPLLDGDGDVVEWIGMASDVTRRKLTEQALRESEARLQRAISIETVGVLFFTLAGRMTDANAAFERMSGYSRDELRSTLHWEMLTPPEFREVTVRAAEHLGVHGVTAPYEKQMVRRDGSRWWGLFAPTRLAGSGRDSECVEFVIDITEAKRAEAERERLLALERTARAAADDASRVAEAARHEAEDARRGAEAASRAKSEFLAVMSHELRTPLNAIGGYAELMEMGLRGPVTEQQRADLARIQQSQRHLLGLINQVLNYTRIDAGAVRYDLTDVPAAEALAAAEALVLPQIRAQGLAYALGSVVPTLRVRADREKLQQILLNLLSNAIKFTEPGGEVRVTCTERAEDVSISVQDTGVGIAADKLVTVFDPFVQVDQRLTRPHEGVGLGLAISRDLARGMGGDLTAESTPGSGSVFTLTLPRAR